MHLGLSHHVQPAVYISNRYIMPNLLHASLIYRTHCHQQVHQKRVAKRIMRAH